FLFNSRSYGDASLHPPFLADSRPYSTLLDPFSSCYHSLHLYQWYSHSGPDAVPQNTGVKFCPDHLDL
ncbi:hypothetical protein HETIRDRAFT_315307, partial [Heterobasidion irregulare TC 32-1]